MVKDIVRIMDQNKEPTLIRKVQYFVEQASKDELCARLLNLEGTEYFREGKRHYASVGFNRKPQDKRQLDALNLKVALICDKAELNVNAGFGTENHPYERLSERERQLAHDLIILYTLSVN